MFAPTTVVILSPLATVTECLGLVVLFLVCHVRTDKPTTYSSGAFLDLSTVPTGLLTSPHYPARYHDKAHNIWLLQAPKHHAVTLTVRSMAGEGSGEGYVNVSRTECRDFLEIRDFSKDGNLLYFSCNMTSEVTVTSEEQWLWVRFRSNEVITNSGFLASFNSTYTGKPVPLTNPTTICQYKDWKCRNHECISWAYRCDGDNDCGCVGPGSDEYMCGGINWPIAWKLSVGTSIGTVVFIVLFTSIGMWDLFIKRRQEEENQRLLEVEKSRRRRRFTKAPVIVPPVAHVTAGITTLSVPTTCVTNSDVDSNVESEAL